MPRTALRLAMLVLPIGLAGCFVAPAPYDEPYYSGDPYYYGPPPPAVVVEPEYRWAVPRYRVEEHVYAPSRRVWYGHDRDERRYRDRDDHHDERRSHREHDRDDD